MEKTINGHTKKEAMDFAFKLGFESEKNRLSCSQSSFHAITTVLGWRNDQGFKIVQALEAGGADSGLNSCGAFCGALAAFGLFFARDYVMWQQCEHDLKASQLGEKLLDKFHEKYGSAICEDIQISCLGFATRFVRNGRLDQAAFKKFEKHGGHEVVAPTIVGLAAYWAIDILWDELPGDQNIDFSDIPSKEEAEKSLAELRTKSMTFSPSKTAGRIRD
jgi:C_GCAxxG_C_C family probable redox protein